MNKSPKGKYSLLQSFTFAFSGIVYALLHERNLRIHFCMGAYMLYFSRYYAFTRAEYAILLLVIGFVVTCELFNTAVENTVDLKTPVYDSIAKIAKDVAAGAVLVSALTSVAVGFMLFWEPPVLSLIFADILDRLYIWLPLVALTLAFMFLPRKSNRKK